MASAKTILLWAWNTIARNIDYKPGAYPVAYPAQDFGGA